MKKILSSIKVMGITFVLSFLIIQILFAEPLILPKKVTPLSSAAGNEILNRSLNRVYFWPLMLHFESQENLAYCSIASSVMVLNALNIKAPNDPNFSPFEIFTQNNFFTPDVEKVLPMMQVKKHGATLDQISQALKQFPVKIQTFHANQITQEKFRQLAMHTIENNDGYVIVNFYRPNLGETGFGHMSPLAAYDKKTDSFLLLDVAKYRYEPAWIKTADLWAAIDTYDQTAKNYRGLMIISK